MRKSVRILLLAPVFCLAGIIPAGAESFQVGTSGNSSYCVPFGCSGVSVYQQVFDAALFVDVLDVRGVDFLNTVNDCCGDAYVDPAHYELWLSTTSAAVNGLDPHDLAANRGADATRVFAGRLGGNPDGDVPPGPDSTLSFTWTTGFTFDPQNGNLLLEVRKTGGSFFGDDGTYLDFDPAQPGTSLVSNWGGDPAGYWNNRSAGLVTRFRGTFASDPDPVAEPATLILLGTGLAAVLARARRSIDWARL